MSLLQIEAIHLVMQPLDLGDFLVRDGLAGKASGEAFQAAHDVEKLAPDPARSSWRTRAPRLGSSSINPSAARTFSASRSGVREIPSISQSCRSGTRAALWNVAFDDVIAQPHQDFVVQRGLLAVRTR